MRPLGIFRHPGQHQVSLDRVSKQALALKRLVQKTRFKVWPTVMPSEPSADGTDGLKSWLKESS